METEHPNGGCDLGAAGSTARAWIVQGRCLYVGTPGEKEGAGKASGRRLGVRWTQEGSEAKAGW